MKNRGGFTIVETIITLTVSSVLFVTVMLLFSGRQDRVEFSQGLRDIEAQIRDIANDVRNGYIPTVSGGYSCEVISGAVTISQGSGGGSGCIFAGKAMFFDSINGQIITYSLAGDKSANSLAGLKPKIIANDSIDTSEIYNMPAGIKLLKGDGSILEGYLLGLFFDVSGVGVGSSKTTPVVVRARVPVGPDYESRKQTIESTNSEGLVNSPISTDGSKKLCFKSGTSDQYGIITLSKGINGITTKIEVDRLISTTTGCAP